MQFSFERARTGFLVMVVMVVITGCSTGVSRIQTWEGAVENAEQVALLSAPGAVKVREVNGKPMAGFLIDDLGLDYELLPGENRVVFTYKTIWAKAERADDDESKVYIVETPRQTVTINAKPGETYQFDIEKPETRKEAETQARNFSVALLNSSGQTVATSSPWVASDSRQAIARAPVPEAQKADVPDDASSITTLEQLKSLWGDATEEEKREFLRWAFE